MRWLVRISTELRGRRGLISQGLWAAVGQVGVAVGLLVGTRLLTERLPREAFGSVALLVAASNLGGTLLCTPLLQALLRLYPDSAAAGNLPVLRRAIARPLLLATAILVAVLLAGGAISAARTHTSFIPYLELGALAVADVIKNFETAMFSAARRQRAQAIWLAVDAWTRSVFAVVAIVVFSPTASSVLLGYLVGAYVTCLGCLLFLRRDGLERRDATPEILSSLRLEIRHYAVPLIPLALVGWISSTSDRYVVAGLVSLKDAGLYAAAYGLASRPISLAATILMTTLRPIYFQRVAIGDEAGARQTFRMWLVVAMTGLSLSVLAIILARHLLARLLLGPEYRAGADLLPYMTPGFALLAMASVYNTISFAHKRSWAVSASEFAGAVASVVVTIPLTRAYGVVGTSAAVPVYYFIQLATAMILARLPAPAALVAPVSQKAPV